MTGKLGLAKLGQFKLGDTELEAQPSGGAMGGIGGRLTIGRRLLGDEWYEDEEAALLFVLTQL